MRKTSKLDWSGRDRSGFDWSSAKINRLTLLDKTTAVTKRQTDSTLTVTCCVECTEVSVLFLLVLFKYCLHCLYLLYEVKLWDTVFWTHCHTHKQIHSQMLT